MSNMNYLSALIAARGTYEGNTDLVGKAIRASRDSEVHPLAFILGLPETPQLREGAQGKIVHVDAEGFIWADFGDDERCEVRNTPDGQYRVQDVGHVNAGREGVNQLYELAE